MSISDGGSKRRPPLPESVREVLEGLDTGDLVLFDRPCSRMGSAIGALVCSAVKVLSGVPFDHIGVVVRDEDGNNVLVEASFTGVAVRPLCERVRRSSASQILVRRLQTNRTEKMQAEARRFVSEVTGVPYTNSASGLLQMVVSSIRYPPAREQRRRIHAETVRLSAFIVSLEKELAICQATNERSQVLNSRLRRALSQRRKAQSFLDDAADDEERPSATPPPATFAAAALPEIDIQPTASAVPSYPQPSPPPPPPPESLPPPYPEDLTTSYEGGLFCSELVAALYQRLGLFDAPYPARYAYIPSDFSPPIGAVGDTGDGGVIKDVSDAEYSASDNDSPPLLSDDEIRVALLGGAALEPGQWIRGGPVTPPSSPPPPADKEDRERGGEDCGGSRSSSLPPAPSSEVAETFQPSQRLMSGYTIMKEPIVGEERGAQCGGPGRWLLPLQTNRRPPSKRSAHVAHFAMSPSQYRIVASHRVRPAIAQLALLLHGLPHRVVSNATAASSPTIKEAVALTGSLNAHPREAWRPATRNENDTRSILKAWVPAATTTTAVSVTAERRRTSTADESLPLLSACQDRTGYGVLGFTSTSTAIAAAAAAAAAATAAAATTLSAAKTRISAGRGGRPGAASVLGVGSGVALALVTGNSAATLHRTWTRLEIAVRCSSFN